MADYMDSDWGTGTLALESPLAAATKRIVTLGADRDGWQREWNKLLRESSCRINELEAALAAADQRADSYADQMNFDAIKFNEKITPGRPL